MNLEKCMKVANQASGAFCRKYTCVDWEEAQAEAYLIMLTALDSWDPTRERTIYSWIAFLVHRELKKIYKVKSFDVNDFDMDAVEAVALCNPEKIFLLYEAHDSLSDLAKKIVKMLSVETGKYAKQTVKNKLEELGISKYKIRYAFKEVWELRTKAMKGELI